MNTGAQLEGDLSFLSLADLLQLFGSNGSTGVLRISSRYVSEPGIIYMSDGNPIDARCDVKTGLDAVYSLFGWTEGRFRFTRESVSGVNKINQSRMELVMNGVKMLDDGQIKRLGPASQLAIHGGGKDSMPAITGPFVDYSHVVDEEEFRDGQEIVKQGKHGIWIWVILEGVVEIIKETDRGPLKILKIGEGAFIGSLASLITGDNVRSATTLAVGNVQLGVLDSQHLFSEFSRMSREFKGVLMSLDKRLKQSTESAVDMFLGNDRGIETLFGREPFINQGDHGKQFFFKIINGDATVIRSVDDNRVALSHLKPGDFIGNLPFLDVGQEPNSAGVYGSGDLKTQPINVDSLRQEYEQLSPTVKNMIENVATCIAATSVVACEISRKG